MSTQRTYTVGNKGIVWRMTDHDSNTWTDVSLTSMIGQLNPLVPASGEGPTIVNQLWLNNINLVDVMTDPNDSTKVCTISGRALENRTLSIPSGHSGIFMSHDGGNNWFFPAGDWVDVCDTDAALCRNHFEVFYTDSLTIYIISQLGYVFKSVDGGLSFNTVKDANNTTQPVNATGFEWVSCIHMRKGTGGNPDYGVVAAIEDITQIGSGTYVYKTIDGGASWFVLNGGNPILNDILINDNVGEPGGIYISEDQNTIILQTEYLTKKSVDGGATFTGTLNNLRSGLHLTWYETYEDISDDFWVTGKNSHPINNSTDVGSTWTQTLNPPNWTIYGAHFYTQNTGYFTSDRSLLKTTQSGSNPVVSLGPLPAGGGMFGHGGIIADTLLYAVWTGQDLFYYELTDCLGEQGSIVVEGDQISTLFNIWGPNSTNTITITGNPEINDEICWSINLYDGPLPVLSLITVYSTDTVTVYDNCQQCVPPPPPSLCWRLKACVESTGQNCETICAHSGFDFTPWENQWIFINGDTTCAYKPIRVRETVYCTPDTVSTLCGLAPAWSVEYKITSFIFNGVQYVTGAQPTYTMTDVNFDPLECTGLTCASTPCGTTENSYGNIPDFLNSYFTSLGVDCPLVAFPNDPANTPFVSDTSYRIQYSVEDSYLLILEKTGATGSSTYQYSNNQGKIVFTVDGATLPNCVEDVDTLCSGEVTAPIVNLDIPIVATNCLKAPCLLDATGIYTDVTVNGGSDGTITLTITGAQNPLFILWSTGATNVQTLTGLPPGVYSVTISDTGIENCEVHLQFIIVEPAAPPPPPEACEVTPRLGEPGFSVKNCDPKTVIKIKNKFADSVYALFKRMRYGIETCCEFDLDKIDIKNQLLELGEMNDPDACTYKCNSYNVTTVDPDDFATITYRDCFGAAQQNIIDDANPSLTFCARPDTIVSLDNPITVTYIEECCDAVQTINMLRYCITMSEDDVSAVITWLDYAGVERMKTLTNIEGSCGPEGTDVLYICAQEGSVDTTTPQFVTITEKGTC